MQPKLARHPPHPHYTRQHATHTTPASKKGRPFLKLIFIQASYGF